MSTPIPGNGRHGRSASSLRSGPSISRRRRRSLGSATPNRFRSSSVSNSIGPENDDAAERQQALSKRRARRPSFLYTPNKLPQARAANTPRLLGWSNRRTPVRKQLMNKNALCDMYETVLKKVARNAINKKNAWDVQMCSYVPELVRMEETNFARNGTVINAASIILAHQIDSVHDRGHTVWKNLITNTTEKKSTEELREAARIKRRYNKKTLAKSGITTNIEDLISSRDAFFEKTAASFDAGGTEGLMTKNLLTQKGGSLVFNSDDKLTAFTKKNDLPEVQIIPENIFDSIPFPSQRRLRRSKGLFPQASTCTRTIQFYNRQSEAIEQGIDDDSVFNKSMDLTEKLDFEESMFEESTFNLNPPESDNLSDMGAANEMAELQKDALINIDDMMCADQDGERFIWDGDEEPEDPHAFRAPDLEELTQYFNRDNRWMGTNRKLAALRKIDEDPSLVRQEQRAQRKRRKINFFDFIQRSSEAEEIAELEMTQEQIDQKDQELRIHVMQQVDQTLFHRVEPKSLMLTQKVLKQWRSEPRILPRDLKVMPDMFFRPALRPSLKLHCPERKRQDNVFGEQSDNALDILADPAQDSESAAPFDLPLEEAMDLGGPAPIMDENLGELLNWGNLKEQKKLEIPYTREPCEFDVSLMKRRIWRRICTHGTETEEGEKMISYDALFKTVIPELSRKTTRTITVHIFYVCLLYCCNEYKLRLKQPGMDDCDNFEIFTTHESPLPSRVRARVQAIEAN